MRQVDSSPAFELASDTPDTLSVRGVLSFSTAAQALHALQSTLSAETVTRLDLSGVTHADSAGLACVLTVLGEASVHGRPLHLAHVPDGMQALAGVCGADRLLG